MKNRKIISVLCIIIMITNILVGCSEKPEDYPSKSIEIICPYSPGGGSDTFGRAVADGFNRIFKETTVVTNRTGGSGQVGASYVIGKKNDPYTLITANSGDVSTWFDMDINVKSFKNIAIIAWDINVLLVSADSPYYSLDDLIEAAKSDPSKITLGGTSVGSDSHTLMLMLQDGADFEATYVPFEGGGEVTSALLGGHISCSWSNPSEALGLIETGKVRALGVASNERARSMPDVPTMKEQGYDVVWSQYRGLQAPPELDEAYVEILADAMRQVSESPEFQELAKNNYWEIDFVSGDDMAAVMDEQIAVVAKYKN